jgi:hypothetical protein
MGIAFSGADIAKVLIIVAVVGTTSLVIFFFILRGHINLWRSKDEKHLATIIPLTWFVFIIFSYFIAYKVYPEFARHSSLPIGGNFEEVESFIIIVTLISLLSCSHIAFVEKLKRKEGSPVLSKLALYSLALSFSCFPASLLLAPFSIFKIERSEGRFYGKRLIRVSMAISLLVIACLKIIASASYFNGMVGWWVLAFAGAAVVLWVVSLVFCLIAARYRPPVWVRWASPLAVLVLAIIIGFESPASHFWLEYQMKPDLINAQNKILHLARDTEIQKIWCLANTNVYISYDGKLSEATLAKDQTIDGITYAGKTGIGFFGSGKVHYGIRAKDTSIQGFLCAAGNKVLFNEDGSLNSCTLAQNHTMFGITIPAKSHLELRSAKDWIITLATPFTFNGTTYAPGTYQQFYEGHLQELTSSTDVTVQGIVCAQGRTIAFHDSGQIESCTLAEAQIIQGVTCAKERDVSFSKKGSLNK